MTVQNKSAKEYDIEVMLRADTMLYTGATKNEIKKNKQELHLGPYASKC